MARRELSDDDWALVEPLMPIGVYGPYPHRLRDQFEGVIWRFRTGSQWREVPQQFGPWSTVYDRFCQWRDAGAFQVLVEALIAEAARRGQADLLLVSVDSTIARAHHDAAGARVGENMLAALEEAIVLVALAFVAVPGALAYLAYRRPAARGPMTIGIAAVAAMAAIIVPIAVR